jgi:hypothetical protein
MYKPVSEFVKLIMKTHLLLLPLALLTSGCVALSTYTPPKDSDAKITFEGYHTFAGISKDTSCSARQMVKVSDGLTFDPSKSHSSSTLIASGNRIFIEQGYSRRHLCRIVISFEPRRNAEYISKFNYDKDICRMAVYRVMEGGGIVPETSSRQEPTSPLCLS